MENTSYSQKAVTLGTKYQDDLTGMIISHFNCLQEADRKISEQQQQIKELSIKLHYQEVVSKTYLEEMEKLTKNIKKTLEKK